MRTKSVVVAVLFFVVPLTTLAADQDTARTQVHQFDSFLDPHPELGSRLTHDPGLVKSPQFLKQNPELEQFLKSHPEIRRELNANPNGFMGKVDAYRREVQQFDDFLKAHPAVHNELLRNPRLADDGSYLGAHPDLKQFLDTHVGVRTELQSDPANFMNREKGYERWMYDRSHPRK
jgi:phage-related protein